MNQFDFYKFWRKYGNFILIALFFLILSSYCNRQTTTRSVAPQTQEEQEKDSVSGKDDQHLKSLEELMRDRRSEQESRPGGFLTTLVLLLMGVAVVWLVRQKWMQALFQQWFPGRVHFRVSKGKDRVTGRKLMRIAIENNTREGLTFMAPMIVFSKWGKERRFRIRGSNQEESFPLTLTPGTGHRLLLDLDQFYEKIPDLKDSTRVGASIETTDGKKFKKFVWPRWLDLLIR